MAIITADKVRDTQYARSFDFEVKLETTRLSSTPFKDWIPVVDIDYGLWDIELQSFNIPVGSIYLPSSINQTDLQITFLDDSKAIISSFFEDWGLKDVTNNGKMKYLEDGAKRIIIKRLDNNKNIVKTKRLSILPNGNFKDAFSSTPQLKNYSLSFKIVG